MSETSRSPESNTLHIEDAPEGLQLQKLDRIVGLNSDLYAAYLKDKANQTESFDEYAAAAINARLKRNGITEGDSAESHEEYVFAHDIYERISKYDRVDWLTTADGQDMPRRNVVYGQLLERYIKPQPEGLDDEQEGKGAKKEEDETRTEPPAKTPEQLKNMDLEALAKAKHDAFAAKLNAPVYGKKRKELMDAYIVTEEAYLTALREHIENQIGTKFPEGIDDRAALKQFIEQEVNTRARADEAAQRDALIERGGTRAKFLNWYANQSRGKKILVGVGAGVGLGVAGVGLGFVAGALVGGAAGAVAGGAMLASRFGRGYAMRMSAIYKKPAKQPEFAIQDDSSVDTNGFYDQSTDFLSKTSREQIKHAETVKQSAIVGAMGAVALGGMFGAGIHEAVEAVNDHWPAGYLHHSEVWGSRNVVNPSNTVTLPGSSTTTDSGGLDTNPSDNEGFNPNPNLNPEKPDFKILGSDERTISKGESWTETLREIGLSAEHRSELLKEVGPKLKEMGLAYRHGTEWRLNMTEDHKMPEAAIKLLAERAHEHGWSTDYNKFFGDVDGNVNSTADSEIAEYAEGRDESIISPGEGGLEFMREIGTDASDRAELWNDVAPKLDDDLTYRMPDGEWRLNMTDDGLMPVSAIETAAEVANDNGIETNYTDIIEAGTHLSDNNSFTADELVTGYSRDMQPYYDALKGVDLKYRDNVLLAAAQELQSFGLTEKVDGVWRFRDVSSLPPKAEEAISRIAAKNYWELAS